MSDRFETSPVRETRGGTSALQAGQSVPKQIDSSCAQVANEIYQNALEQRDRLRFILEALRGPSDENHAEGPQGPGLLPALISIREVTQQNEQLTHAIGRLLTPK